MNKLTLSDEAKEKLADGSDIVVSVSGGKDSTATCLHLFENGFSQSDFTRVFMDTGWEHKNTYDYLDELETHVGPITRLKQHVDITRLSDRAQSMVLELEQEIGWESPFIRHTFKRLMFPYPRRKWCTSELKMKLWYNFLDKSDNDLINVIGVRRAESLARANVSEWEWGKKDYWVWRPLYNWLESDVIDIHHRFSIRPNGLYLNGMNRVGCYPCIHARKKEYALLSDERTALLFKMEKYIGELLLVEKSDVDHVVAFQEKMIEKYGHPLAPFTQSESIYDIREWGKTARGGTQYMLFDMEEPTCSKWGMCDFGGNEA